MKKRRPKSVQELYRGAKRVAPGLYLRPDGSSLVNAAEVLEQVGLPDTQENRDLVSQVITEIYSVIAGRAIVLRAEGGSARH